MAKKNNKSGLGQRKNLSVMQLFVFAAIFGSIGAAISWAALAAPHNGGGGGGSRDSGSLTLKMVNDANADGTPNYKDTVTFNVTTTASQPFVRVECLQGTSLVYSETNGFWSGYPWDTNYDLGPTSAWQSGAADCTAKLVVLSNNGKQTTLATLPFHVNG